MDLDESEPLGSLYRLDVDRNVKKLPGIQATVSNGLAWSADLQTMYYIDSPTRQVRAFVCDLELGTIANERAIISFGDADGFPDGMTIDLDGMLWIAHWGGARVSRWDPTSGERIGDVPLPALNVTSCCFGGPQLSDLYVTSASNQMTPQQLKEYPHSGALFRLASGVQGTPSVAYAG